MNISAVVPVWNGRDLLARLLDTLEAQKNPDQFHLVRANHLEYLKPVVGVSQVRVRVWVEKLDVFADAEGVGAMVERTRPQA